MRQASILFTQHIAGGCILAEVGAGRIPVLEVRPALP